MTFFRVSVVVMFSAFSDNVMRMILEIVAHHWELGVVISGGCHEFVIVIITIIAIISRGRFRDRLRYTFVVIVIVAVVKLETTLWFWESMSWIVELVVNDSVMKADLTNGASSVEIIWVVSGFNNLDITSIHSKIWKVEIEHCGEITEIVHIVVISIEPESWDCAVVNSL